MQCTLTKPNAMHCTLVTQCNTMEKLWQSGILQKQKSWLVKNITFPTNSSNDWRCFRVSHGWPGVVAKQIERIQKQKAEGSNIKPQCWIQPPTMRCEGGRGGTQRLFRKMSSTGNVVDLFQMELNGKVPKLLKQGTRTWLLQNYLVGAEVGVRNGSSALWENSEERSQVVALLVHSCAAGQDCNVCTVQGWHSYNSGLALLLWK